MQESFLRRFFSTKELDPLFFDQFHFVDVYCREQERKIARQPKES